MTTKIAREARVGISARQPSILGDDHRRRKRIGIERGLDLFCDAVDIENELGSNDPAPTALTEDLVAVPFLTLARQLLDAFIRHKKIRLPLMPREVQAIDIGGTVVVIERHAAERAMVREIFRRRRIEVAIGLGRCHAAAHRATAPTVAAAEASAHRSEAAAADVRRSVQAAPNIAGGCHFDDTTKLAACTPPENFPSAHGQPADRCPADRVRTPATGCRPSECRRSQRASGIPIRADAAPRWLPSASPVVRRRDRAAGVRAQTASPPGFEARRLKTPPPRG